MHPHPTFLRFSLLTSVIGAVALVGCADPRNAPGALEPGNSISVAERAIGTGGQGTRAYDDGATLGAVPHIDYQAPFIPVKTDGVTDQLFFWGQESLDGEAERGAVWVNVTVANQSFTRAHRNNAKSLLNDAETDIPRTGMIPRSARLSNPRSQSSDAQNVPLPLIRQGQPSTRVTVATMNPATGRPAILGTQEVPREPGVSTGDPDGVQRMVERFNALQSSQGGAPGAAPAPAPTTAAPGAIDTTPVPRSAAGR